MNGLAELGGARDALPIPAPELAPWAEGDAPHAEEIDLNEYPVELLKLKKCRSFRADLRHKLTLIIRAHGGYGRRGVLRAAYALRVSRQTLNQWLRWEASPRSRNTFARIDNLYAEALEKLVAEKTKKKK